MEELFQNIDDGRVHYAGEVRKFASVEAISTFGWCPDLLLGNCRCSWCSLQRQSYISGRPVFVSGDCKQETGEEHAEIIKMVFKGVNSLQAQTKLQITSIASVGETWCGSSFILLTFKKELSHNLPIFSLLKPLKFLNLYVGDDDLTCDKD